MIITTLVFATLHGVTFDANLSFVFDPVYIIVSGVGGYLFGENRNYSGSLTLAIVMHNGFHLVRLIVPWLVQSVLN